MILSDARAEVTDADSWVTDSKKPCAVERSSPWPRESSWGVTA